MNSYFAKPERTDEKELNLEIQIVNKHPLMSSLLHSVSGLLVIVDENRQVIAINDSFLKLIGVENPSKTLGLRLGEALKCVHAHDEPAGCGTSKFCSTCGAAIAMVASLGGDVPIEKICALEAKKENHSVDLVLKIRSHPIKIDNQKFLLLFIQDITIQEQRAALERAFFHDIKNILGGIAGASELLFSKREESNLLRMIYQSSLRLIKEADIQRSLFKNRDYEYQPLYGKTELKYILRELEVFFKNHPASKNKTIAFPKVYSFLSFETDVSLLLRVLTNMITNAFEATEENGLIKIWVEHQENILTFYVWNKTSIPEKIALRIFQRNFSTKKGEGRGIGTYSMKFFGEKILGGEVNFTTSEETGTIFQFSLKLKK